MRSGECVAATTRKERIKETHREMHSAYRHGGALQVNRQSDFRQDCTSASHSKLAEDGFAVKRI